MNTKSNENLRRRQVLGYIVLAVLFLGLLAVVTRRAGGDASSTDNRGLSSNPAEPDAVFKANSASGKERRARGTLVSGSAKGSIPDVEYYRDWGFLMVENLIGKPQSGDIAYLARLGPDRGLMKVLAVEGDKAVLCLDTLERNLIRDGDRVETMPPKDYSEKQSPTKP